MIGGPHLVNSIFCFRFYQFLADPVLPVQLYHRGAFSAATERKKKRFTNGVERTNENSSVFLTTNILSPSGRNGSKNVSLMSHKERQESIIMSVAHRERVMRINKWASSSKLGDGFHNWVCPEGNTSTICCFFPQEDPVSSSRTTTVLMGKNEVPLRQDNWALLSGRTSQNMRAKKFTRPDLGTNNIAAIVVGTRVQIVSKQEVKRLITASKVVDNRLVRSMFRDPHWSINCNPFLLTPNCPRLT